VVRRGSGSGTNQIKIEIKIKIKIKPRAPALRAAERGGTAKPLRKGADASSGPLPGRPSIFHNYAVGESARWGH